MVEFHKIYKPIIAAPFTNDETYVEVLPCDALKPYIRCFWGTVNPYLQKKADESKPWLVIPDTCMDIMFHVNFTDNRINAKFCGIDDSTFLSHEKIHREAKISTFGIRFYAWSVVVFSEESMKDVKNAFFDVGYHFSRLKKEIEPLLFDTTTMKDRVAVTERYLQRIIHPERMNSGVMEAVGEILKNKGNIKMEQLTKDIHIGSRQLERLFKENVGISPKQLTNLVRYQYLWNDVLFNNNFNIQDEVYKLGYTDQAHLSHEFKRFHTMNITDAKKHAFKDVAFLQ